MLEMADIMAQYGPEYLAKYGDRMPPSHRRAMEDIVRCRTPELGGQLYACDDCGEYHYSYHSCQNRSCPKCQNDQAQEWLIKQGEKLLAVRYFLVTFTLPQELREIARSNQKLVYGLLFSESAAAMQKLAKDPKYVGGKLGFMGVLHTWKRDMNYHPHVHYLVPGGGLTMDGKKWRFTQKNFFLPVKALSKIFRAKFRDALKKTSPQLFAQIPVSVWKKDWVVHSEPAGRGIEVLKYFAPYVYRIAISNNRLVKMENDQVTFRYKDSKTKKWNYLTLPAEEFMRRFLQHVLPRGFQKVRYYGWLSSRQKKILQTLQLLLGTVNCDELIAEYEERKKVLCPKCGKEMHVIEELPRMKRGPPIEQ